MTEEQLKAFGQKMVAYCEKFVVPIQYLFEILEDQKVTPMIRGKAMEYNAFLLLDGLLPKNAWSVQKLNLNAQPGIYDEDITITHRRSGMILKVESKSAVRGSISDGRRSRKMRCPHFKVKCHRSRSNMALAKTSNDRYSVDSFDVLMTNPLNAIFEGKTVGERLELIHDQEFRKMLFDHYKVNTEAELFEVCAKDWRFCIPKDIAVEDYIPRTPYAALENDNHWRPMGELEARLNQVVEENWAAGSHRPRTRRR
jgi:hypothetical protein